MTIVSKLPKPSAVPMAIPAISPIAQPVRQCSVALIATCVSSRPPAGIVW
jgi:hypothetical protein